MINIDMTGKVVFLTGSAGTIGSKAVEVFAKAGAAVYFTDIAGDRGTALEKRLQSDGLNVNFIVGDSTSDSDCKCVVDIIFDREGHIDALINNVGWGGGPDKKVPYPDYDEATMLKVISICFDGVYSFTRHILPKMMENGGGRIVNTGSVAGFRAPLMLQTPYTSTKAAIMNITMTWASRYGKYGITVNSVIPGSVMNDQIKDAIWGSKEKEDSMFAHIPAGRIGQPEDIANAMLFLCSPLASYVNGCMLNVDGGWSSGYALG